MIAVSWTNHIRITIHCESQTTKAVEITPRATDDDLQTTAIKIKIFFKASALISNKSNKL